MEDPARSGSVVLVGGGQAALACATALRKGGWLGTVTIVGAEPHYPYERPPLSKTVLTGAADPGRLPFVDAATLAASDIRFVHGEAVTLDREARVVELADGDALGWDHLVLATGANARELPRAIPGSDAPGVLTLRTIADAVAIRDRLREVDDVVIAGGGFIGVEVAAALASIGKRVTIVELLPTLLSRAAPPPLAAWVEAHLTGLGVQVLTGTAVAEVETDDTGAVAAVVDGAGGRHPAGLVVVGIGAAPSTGLAERAGLDVDGGIVVDERLRTADPTIHAIGDCAVQVLPDGRRHRPESVQAAQDQGHHVAHALLGQEAGPYERVPWFWSDIGDAHIHMAGRCDLATTFVTRGDPADGGLSLFGFDDDRFVGVAVVDRQRDYVAGRTILRAGLPLTPAQAADEGFDLRAWSRTRPAARK